MLIHHPKCIGQYVTIQKEVADRLLADPSTKEYGPLTIIVGALGDVKRICTVKPTCFWPQPKVESTIVSIFPSPLGRGVRVSVGDSPWRGEGSSALETTQQRQDFARFVTQLFTKRRKQLGSILGRDVDWPEGVRSDLRPEALPPDRIVALWRVRSNGGA
jgi:16S rRNA A1518/A1519 N6-dimethyltransferase RsmA/KsgA/DIM1 with predicted DNA glycosylase/AP lyase activity